MGITLQDVFRRGFEDFASSRSLPQHIRRAARFMLACRTPIMGRHVRTCPEGHVSRVYYNSCRHRACPQCGHADLEEWIRKRTEQFLACDHYHVIFTLPHELEPFWHQHRQLMSQILFQCTRDTLFELLEDPKYLGATPGVLAALHTWGRTLSFHPHIHAVVTGGGWDGDCWKPVRNGYLLPIRVVSALFRGKFLATLQSEIDKGHLMVPESLSQTRWGNCLRQLYRKRWNVNIQERYPHTRGILRYLGRYLLGGPIRNHRLIRADHRNVEFSYVDHRDQRPKTLKLTLESFIQRICWHIPVPRRHQVRMWGLYARAKKPDRERARTALPDPISQPTAKTPDKAPPPTLDACPVCGRPLEFSGLLPSRLLSHALARDPPAECAVP